MPGPASKVDSNNCQVRVGYGNVAASGAAGVSASGSLDGTIFTFLNAKEGCPDATLELPHPRDFSRDVTIRLGNGGGQLQ